MNEQELVERKSAALDLIVNYGGTDGAHHKQWVLDQVLRALSGNEYDTIVRDFSEGGLYADWDKGIAP